MLTLGVTLPPPPLVYLRRQDPKPEVVPPLAVVGLVGVVAVLALEDTEVVNVEAGAAAGVDAAVAEEVELWYLEASLNLPLYVGRPLS